MNRQTLRVYPIVDLGSCGGNLAGAEQLVHDALNGGATIIQLRNKGEHMETLADVYRHVLPTCHRAAVPVIINDRSDAALELGADGVHLGQRDAPPELVRGAADRLGRDDFIIGVSVTTVAEAKRALEAGADYLSASPVFGTATKPDIERPVGLEGIRAIRAALPDVPLVAIGGIRRAHVAMLLEAGADGVAFISAMGAHPEQAVRSMGSVRS